MRRFTAEEMLLAFELEQMLYDYIEELDLNGSRDAGRFYAEDGAFVTPGGAFVGPAAIQALSFSTSEAVGGRMAYSRSMFIGGICVDSIFLISRLSSGFPGTIDTPF